MKYIKGTAMILVGFFFFAGNVLGFLPGLALIIYALNYMFN